MNFRNFMKRGICVFFSGCLIGGSFISCGESFTDITSNDPGNQMISRVKSDRVDQEAQDVTVVDFSVKEGFPLLKRQNMFSMSYGLAALSHLERDAVYLQELRSENMRIDMGMGAGQFCPGLGLLSPEVKASDFSTPDLVTETLIQNGIMPYFCYCWMPLSLQNLEVSDEQKYLYPPKDYEGWKTLCKNIAAHYVELGYPLAGHEIWNEPDWDNVFFRGTWEEYCKMYEYAVLGIKEANPDARVGGMSVALFKEAEDAGKIDQFLQYVKERQLPFDFMSIHNYGTELYLERINLANDALSRYGDTFETTGIDVNEFHVATEFTPEDASSSYVIPDIWDAIININELPMVTSVNWAAWYDNGSDTDRLGMVDGESGMRYAPHHAISIYNNMPIARVRMNTKNYVNGFASVEDHRAGVVVYNRTEEKKPFTVALENLPFKTADVKIYAIDAEHSSYVDTKADDELECIYSKDNISTKDLNYHGELLPRGTFYIAITDHKENTDLKAVWSLADGKAIAGEKATVIKKEYDFPDRTKKTFAEFDLGSFTAYAGMGNAELGTGMGGVILKNLPDSFTVTKESWGVNQEMSQNANQFLKVDYRGENDEVLYSKLYLQGAEVTPSIPWSERVPDEIQKISEGEPFVIDFQNVPDGFSGIIVLSYGITDYGHDTTVRFRLE